MIDIVGSYLLLHTHSHSFILIINKKNIWIIFTIIFELSLLYIFKNICQYFYEKWILNGFPFK